MHHVNLLNRDFFFESDQLNVTLYAHFIDFSLYIILIKNDSNYYVKVFKNYRLDMIQKVDFDNYYHIIFEKTNVVEMINRRSQKEHQ